MKILRDYEGREIRLTDERSAHVLEHLEMVGLEDAIGETLARPQRVIQSLSDPQARLYFGTTRELEWATNTSALW